MKNKVGEDSPSLRSASPFYATPSPRACALKPIFIAFLFTLLLASCCAVELPTTNIKIVRSDGTEIPCKVEIAKTPAQRSRGFMERKKIPGGTGMIFVFEQDQVLSFWMKNTPHPLSIAYVSKDGTIKDIFDMTPFSLASVTSTISVRYALEVPQGWFSKNGIKVGDKLEKD